MTIEEAKKTIVAQQILISQQRAALKRQHNARLAIVAGQYADQINPDAEALKQVAMTPSVELEFKLLIDVLKFYGNDNNYKNGGGVLSIGSEVMKDRGEKARQVLNKIA